MPFPFSEELFYFFIIWPLVVFNVTFAIVTAIQEATSRVLFRRPASIIRLFIGWLQQVRQPFRLMDLPPELRNAVYGHLADEYWAAWRRNEKRPPHAWLRVNKQVYQEAMRVLYKDVHCIFEINAEFNLAQCYPKVVVVHRGEKRTFAGLMRRHWRALGHTHTVWLNIDLPHQTRTNWFDPGFKFIILEIRIATVCAWYLVKMPALRTVRVFFFGKKYGAWGLRAPLCPPVQHIPGLLGPLTLVKRENPGVVMQVPGYHPVSTAMLSLAFSCIDGRTGRRYR